MPVIDCGKNAGCCEKCMAMDFLAQQGQECGRNQGGTDCCENTIWKESVAKNGKRKTGSVYRRAMKKQYHKKMMKRLWGKYVTVGPYVESDWVDGVFKPVGSYIKYPQNSKLKRTWKNHSNRVVRKRKELFKGNQYRKCFDYWWTIT